MIVGGVLAVFSWRVAHEVAAVERTIVVPLPTAVAAATATRPPPATAAARRRRR